ncbi:MAG: hypothetical protein K5669_06085 [Lachnospiraceae bacterium]|nr:hypothetical protein [Lachnospiraceae bacterium]
MFTSKELSILTLDYFQLPMCSSDVCELVSQNGDHWMILKQQVTLPRTRLHNVRHFDYTFRLYHRHNADEGFHLQGDYVELLSAALEIICHDDYRLGRQSDEYIREVLEWAEAER